MMHKKKSWRIHGFSGCPNPKYPAPVLCRGPKQALSQFIIVKRKPDEGRLNQAGTGSKKPRRNSAKHQTPCLKIIKNINQRQS